MKIDNGEKDMGLPLVLKVLYMLKFSNGWQKFIHPVFCNIIHGPHITQQQRCS